MTRVKDCVVRNDMEEWLDLEPESYGIFFSVNISFGWSDAHIQSPWIYPAYL